MKRRGIQKVLEEVAKSEHGRSLPKTPSRSPNKTSPTKSPTAVHDLGDEQILRGGPKTWPPEVVEHVQSLLELGWSSSKVSNHYSLIAFGLSTQQVDLVRSLPTTKRAPAADVRRSDGLSDELVAHVRKLILEGKTNTAIRNHYCLASSNASEAHIQSVRTAIEKEAWFVATGSAASSPMKRSASKIKPPSLSKQVRSTDHKARQSISLRSQKWLTVGIVYWRDDVTQI